MRFVLVVGVIVLVCGVARAEPPGMTPPMASQAPNEEPVSEIQQIVAPPTAAMIGFGLGHVVEGRWHEKGWIFTLGESIALAAFMVGAANIECESHCSVYGASMVAGMLGMGGLRIWEVYDTVEGARSHNRRIMQLGLHFAPARGGGAVAGLALHF